MMVRRYIVKDMPEAVSLIRKDLGKEAVILSTKRIRVKMWLGLWRAPRIEVMAAVGADIPVRAPSTQFRDVARELEKISERAQVTSINSTASTVNPLASTSVKASTEQMDKQGQTYSKEHPDTSFIPFHPESIVNANRAGVPAESEVAATTVAMPKNVSLDLENVLSELSDMKRMLGEAMLNQPTSTVPSDHLTIARALQSLQQGQGNHNSIDRMGQVEELLDRLRHQGVNSAIVEWVHGELQKLSGQRNFSGEQVGEMAQSEQISWVEEVARLLLSRFSTYSVLAQPIANTSRVVAFVGPTGVGKTTTIAKLAALHVLTGKRSVGLVTADTFRIAAVEQLKTYATILNVPLEVVGEGDSLQSAIQRLSHCDLLFIDTAGRNYFDFECMQGIQKLLSDVAVDETYLVLSLTSKPDDLELLASLFQRMTIDKFLFTKMDETSSYGAVLNLLQTYHKPLSYISTGQNVPDDIEVASLESIIRSVVGGAV